MNDFQVAVLPRFNATAAHLALQAVIAILPFTFLFEIQLHSAFTTVALTICLFYPSHFFVDIFCQEHLHPASNRLL
jgi:hypothetical protein